MLTLRAADRGAIHCRRPQVTARPDRPFILGRLSNQGQAGHDSLQTPTPSLPELLFGTDDLDHIFDTVAAIQRRATAE